MVCWSEPYVHVGGGSSSCVCVCFWLCVCIRAVRLYCELRPEQLSLGFDGRMLNLKRGSRSDPRLHEPSMVFLKLSEDVE